MLSRRAMIGGSVGLTGLLAAGPALALTLDEARASGQVGELPNGYVGVVSGGAGVQALVDSVNAQRRAHYRQIAESEDVPMAAVEQRAGAQLIERAQPGHYVMNASGAWVRK